MEMLKNDIGHRGNGGCSRLLAVCACVLLALMSALLTIIIVREYSAGEVTRVDINLMETVHQLQKQGEQQQAELDRMKSNVKTVLLTIFGVSDPPNETDEWRVKRAVDDRANVAHGGAMYVRWGRTTCPETGAELVYNGVAGSGHYTHHGGGGNYQCLPSVPQWGRFQEGFQSKSFMYGVEYQVNTFNPFLSSHLSGNHLHDQNAVCAVCRVPDRASEQMIPAWNTCPPSWSLEYHGYLMASYHGHAGRSTFVCVDEDPEVNSSGGGNEDGGLWYPVEAHCGSLPCPNYAGGREITCAVCTK